MPRLVRIACLVALCAFFTGCASTIKFESVPKAQLTLHTWKNIDGAGKPLGETPLELSESDLENSIVKMAAPGRRPQFFAFPGSAQGTLRLKINLAESPQEGMKVDSTAVDDVSFRKVNQVNRKLLAAFQALIDKDYPAADGLANAAQQAAPQLAAPLVVQGLAKLYAGDKDGARVAFKNAQSIDPEDAALTEMLKVLQQ